ncbi:MAG TPA: DNA polymerase III subunit beta [Anaerolineae bacterium]|nr:DNA polymerase III subunit beta [Anaerolineae bacterium]
MNVSCLQENLAKGLGIAGRIVKERSTLLALSNILLASDGDRLKLAATNLEIGITCWIGAQIEQEGAITVPARTLVDLVNTLPPGKVDMSMNGSQTLKLQSGRFKSNVKGIDADEFPLIPHIEGDEAIQIEPDVLGQMIEQVTFAAARDESRPILTGVLARFDGDRLTFAAADGFRLSVRTGSLSATVSQPFEVIVPARALTELGHVLNGQEEPVSIAVTPQRNQIMFRLNSVELVAQLVDGKFPDYQMIMPKSNTARAVLDTAPLIKACKAANVFARESANTVRLTIVPGDESRPGHLAVQATSAETGDNAGEVDASIEGEPLEIAFNVQYLIDALKAVGAPQVSLELTTASSPGVLRPIGDDAFTHVMMPMQLR